jgi:hypothetical protein
LRDVDEAVRSGRRIAVRSGGHCLEGLVCDPAVQVVVDLSGFTGVRYDPTMNAFEVAAGSTLREIFASLYRGWGVTIPGGACAGVGAGGHIIGGGYGALSRRHGSVVDHLYGVEVVVVDRTGQARSVIATRDSSDPALRDLWWAHTGGGGGNFGVVTRFWMRAPGVSTMDPGGLLPKPPTKLLICRMVFPWGPLDQVTFSRLLANYCTWYERNSAPDSDGTGLYSVLGVPHQQMGGIGLSVQVDATTGGADRILDDFVSTVGGGVGVQPYVRERRSMSWLHATTWNGIADGGDLTRRSKMKMGYLRKGFTSTQLFTIYRHLTRTDYPDAATAIMFDAYGGRTNSVAPAATAMPQRDSIIKAAFTAGWLEPADDNKHVTALRELFRDVYAQTGGVPVPNDVSDGCYINYPDADLADPAWNTSGMSPQALYYKGNYPRLRKVKAAWDPMNVFRHSLSIEP